MILQRHRQPYQWNITENSETDLSICMYLLHNGEFSKGERLDCSINGTGNHYQWRAKIRFLPHILTMKNTPYGLKI